MFDNNLGKRKRNNVNEKNLFNTNEGKEILEYIKNIYIYKNNNIVKDMCKDHDCLKNKCNLYQLRVNLYFNEEERLVKHTKKIKKGTHYMNMPGLLRLLYSVFFL